MGFQSIRRVIRDTVCKAVREGVSPAQGCLRSARRVHRALVCLRGEVSRAKGHASTAFLSSQVFRPQHPVPGTIGPEVRR